MLNAMEELMRLHPASYVGRRARGLSDLEAFEELESRHPCPRRAYETDRREPTWMIGEVAAAVAMLVLFIGVLTAIAHLTVDASGAAQRPLVADAVETR